MIFLVSGLNGPAEVVRQLNDVKYADRNYVCYSCHPVSCIVVHGSDLVSILITFIGAIY